MAPPDYATLIPPRRPPECPSEHSLSRDFSPLGRQTLRMKCSARRLVLVICLALTVALPLEAPATAQSDPPPGLSDSGRALWNFEALLHDTFGSRMVCTRGSSLDFVAGTCSPLATWEPYFYVFPAARHSAFHVAYREPTGGFGNYPQPVKINGHFIACGPTDRTYLMEYSDAATFSIGCVTEWD